MPLRQILLSILLGLVVSLPAKSDLIGHGGMVRSVDVSPDGDRIATGSFDYTARIWNFGEQSELAVLDLHEGPVTSVSFSPSGEYLLTTSDDLSAIYWEMTTFQPVHRLTGHKHKVVTSSFSADGKYVATGAWDKTVRIWDLTEGKAIQTLNVNAPVNAVAFGPNSENLFVGGHHPVIDVWNADTGAIAGKLEGHRGGITALRLSPDGKRMLSASIDKTIKLWDIATQTELTSIQVRDGQVFDVSFSPDGTQAITAGRDGYIVVWDLDTGAPVHEIPAHEKIAWSVAYTPDGRFAISTSSDEQARIWHLETGDRIGMTMTDDDQPKPWLTSDHPGAAVYTKCASCHSLSAEGPQRSGPHFEGLFGRPVGSVEGYRYSEALTSRNFVWDEKTIFQLFDEGPDVMLPGTKMPIQRVTDDGSLKDLVEYMKILTAP